MKYRQEIDGLRAIAVLPVIFFHAGLLGFSGGFVGVDIFFVISGYLITNIILQETVAGSFSLANFYERRVRRILPSLFFVVFVSSIFAWFLLLPAEMKGFSKSLIGVVTFSSNFYFAKSIDYFATAAELKPLLHTWSLAVEEQFYFIFPLLFIVFWRFFSKKIVILFILMMILSIAFAQYGVTHLKVESFFLLPSRAWELLLGSLMAFYLAGAYRMPLHTILENTLGIIGFSLILYSIFVFNNNTPSPSVFTLFPTIGTCLIILFASQKTMIGRFLGNWFLVKIGLISYSAYLWHQPVLAFARHNSLHDLTSSYLWLLVMLTLVLAYLTWKYIELPFRNSHIIKKQTLYKVMGVMALVLVLFGVFGRKTDGYRLAFRLDPNIMKIEAQNLEVFEANVKKCWKSIDENPDVGAACKFGLTNFNPSVALVGDSHAGALLRELDLYSQKNNISAVGYTYRSCPPLFNTLPIPYTNSDMTCSRLRESFFSNLGNSNTPQTLIVSARWANLVEQKKFDNKEGGKEFGEDWVWDIGSQKDKDYTVLMQKKIIDSVNLMLKNGHKVVLVYPIPEVGWDVPSRLAKIYKVQGRLQPRDGSTSYQTYIDRNKNAYHALNSIKDHVNLIRFKPSDILCNTYVQDRCIVHINSMPLYFDDDHLSDLGARMMINGIFRELHRHKM